MMDSVHSNFWIERKYAANALLLIKDPAAEKALAEALKLDNSGFQSDIFETFMAVADKDSEEVTEAIKDRLKHGNSNVRRMAIRHFANTPGPQSLQLLLDALHDPSGGVVYDAVRGLKNYGGAILDEIVPKMTAKGKDVRIASVRLLGELQDERAIDPLCEQMKVSRNKAQRAEIATALGKLRSAKALPVLLEALEDRAGEVRKSAVDALGKIGDPSALPHLNRSMYADEILMAYGMRRKCARAIGAIKSPQAVEMLVMALDHKDNDVRIAAADGLRRQKAVDAIQALEKKLKYETKPELRKAYEKSLSNLNKLKAKQKRSKASKKVAIDPKSQDPVELLDHENPAVREKAVAMLGKAGGKETIEKLAPRLWDEDIEVRKKAALAIKKLGPADVVDDLTKQLKKYHYDGMKTPFLLEALGLMGSAETLDALRPFLEHDQAHVRRAARTAINRLDKEHGTFIKDFELRQNIDGYIRGRRIDELKKHGQAAVDLLRDILNEEKHLLSADAASILKELGWSPESLYEKVLFYVVNEDLEKLRGLSGQGCKILERLYLNETAFERVSRFIVALRGEKGVDFMLNNIGRTPPYLVSCIIKAIGPEREDIFLAFLQSPKTSLAVKEKFAQYFWSRKSDKAVAPLVEALETEFRKGNVQKIDQVSWILEYFAQCKAKEAVGVLIEIVRSRNLSVGDKAMRVLGEIGSREAVILMRRELVEDGPLSIDAARALQNIDDPTTTPKERALIALNLKDFDTVRELKDHIIPEIMEKVDSSAVHHEFIEIVAEMGDEDALEPIAKYHLGSGSGTTRKAAFDAMKKYGDKAYPYLIEATKSNDPLVQMDAAKLLGRFKTEETVEALVPLLVSKRNGTVVRAAAEALGKIRAPETLPLLMDTLSHHSPYVLNATLKAIAKFKDPAAIADLKKTEFFRSQSGKSQNRCDRKAGKVRLTSIKTGFPAYIFGKVPTWGDENHPISVDNFLPGFVPTTGPGTRRSFFFPPDSVRPSFRAERASSKASRQLSEIWSGAKP